MNKITKAYLAGLLDGEGTITLTRSNKGQLPQPQVSIANNSLKLLQWVKQQVQVGSILTKHPRKATHSISYAWQINRIGSCAKILKLVFPYLLLKQKQADLILNHYPLVTPRNGKYSKEMLRKKLSLVKKIQKLNRRPK